MAHDAKVRLALKRALMPALTRAAPRQAQERPL